MKNRKLYLAYDEDFEYDCYDAIAVLAESEEQVREWLAVYTHSGTKYRTLAGKHVPMPTVLNPQGEEKFLRDDKCRVPVADRWKIIEVPIEGNGVSLVAACFNAG
jgi:hypothetical protein